MYHDNLTFPPGCSWCGTLNTTSLSLCPTCEEGAKAAREKHGKVIRASPLSQETP